MRGPEVSLTDLADGTLAGPEWDAWLDAHPAEAAEVEIARRVRALMVELQAASIVVPAGMGDSSGGWTTAMAAFTADVPELEGSEGSAALGVSSRLQACVPFYPPTDFLQMDAHMLDHGKIFNDMLGTQHGHADPRSPESLLLGCPIKTCPEQVRRANPITYVNSAAPPCLLLHGQRDPLVPYHQSELLYEALSAAGADVTLVLLPAAEHGPVDDFLSNPAVKQGAFMVASRDGQRSAAQPYDPTWDTLIAFFEQHLM